MKELSKEELLAFIAIISTITDRIDSACNAMEDYHLSSRLTNESYKIDLAVHELREIAQKLDDGEPVNDGLEPGSWSGGIADNH